MPALLPSSVRRLTVEPPVLTVVPSRLPSLFIISTCSTNTHVLYKAPIWKTREGDPDRLVVIEPPLPYKQPLGHWSGLPGSLKSFTIHLGSQTERLTHVLDTNCTKGSPFLGRNDARGAPGSRWTMRVKTRQAKAPTFESGDCPHVRASLVPL